MIDDALTRIRQLVDAKTVSIGQVREASGLPSSTIYEMLEPGWSTRAVDNIRALESALPKIEEIAEQAQQGAAQ